MASCAIFGEAFDPGEQGGGIAGEPLPYWFACDLTVNLLIETFAPVGAGDVLAALAFPTSSGQTTLLAREVACRDTPLLATNLLDLGTFQVPATPSTALVEIGGVEGGQNPLATVDTDGDEAANLADTDDDADTILDDTDPDADGDGFTDAAQLFSPDWL